MTNPRNGPLKREEPGPTPEAGPNRKLVDTTTNQVEFTGLRRRRAASWRLPVLESGRSDPWWYPEPGERGYAAASAYLLALGLTPAPNPPALRAMWLAGAESRRVAQVVAERWGLVA
jgi:hypothetical protein